MITFNLSISKKYQDYFDKLIMMAGISSVSTSSLIHKGIKMYVDGPKLVCDPILWDDLISKMSDEEQKETNTLLLQLIQKIADNNDSTT